MTSISTRNSGRASRASRVERAGKSGVNAARYTSFISSNPRMSERKTVAFTTSFRLHPALDNLSWMFARTFWVWALNPDGVVPLFGSVPTCPDTNTNGPATTAPEKGNVPGFGGSIRSIMVSRAASVRTRINVALARGAHIETRRTVRRTPHGSSLPHERGTGGVSVPSRSRNVSHQRRADGHGARPPRDDGTGPAATLLRRVGPHDPRAGPLPDDPIVGRLPSAQPPGREPHPGRAGFNHHPLRRLAVLPRRRDGPSSAHRRHGRPREPRDPLRVSVQPRRHVPFRGLGLLLGDLDPRPVPAVRTLDGNAIGPRCLRRVAGAREAHPPNREPGPARRSDRGGRDRAPGRRGCGPRPTGREGPDRRRCPRGRELCERGPRHRRVEARPQTGGGRSPRRDPERGRSPACPGHEDGRRDGPRTNHEPRAPGAGDEATGPATRGSSRDGPYPHCGRSRDRHVPLLVRVREGGQSLRVDPDDHGLRHRLPPRPGPRDPDGHGPRDDDGGPARPPDPECGGP